jgi:hypothetical protein
MCFEVFVYELHVLFYCNELIQQQNARNIKARLWRVSIKPYAAIQLSCTCASLTLLLMHYCALCCNVLLCRYRQQ